MAEAAQTGMTMDDLNLLSDENVAKDWKAREDRWHSRLAVDDQKRDMVDLEPIGEVVDSGPTMVCMGNDDDFMASIDQLGRELIDMAFDASWLRKEEVANHGDVVRHLDAVWVLYRRMVVE